MRIPHRYVTELHIMPILKPGEGMDCNIPDWKSEYIFWVKLWNRVIFKNMVGLTGFCKWPKNTYDNSNNCHLVKGQCSGHFSDLAIQHPFSFLLVILPIFSSGEPCLPCFRSLCFEFCWNHPWFKSWVSDLGLDNQNTEFPWTYNCFRDGNM